MHLTLWHRWHGERRVYLREILCITAKSKRTVQRWLKHPDTIDPDSLKLIELYVFGLIPSADKAWEAFWVRDDTLYNAQQKRFSITNYQIDTLWLTYDLNRQLTDQVKDYRRREEERALADAVATGLLPSPPTAIIYQFSDYVRGKTAEGKTEG